MIIFLYGPDSYRSKEKLNEIIGHYKKVRQSSLNLINLDASQIDFANFYHNFKISPMFQEKKMVILKNLFLNKNFQEDFSAQIKDLENLKDIILTYEDQAVDQRLKIFKILTKECKSQEFGLLESSKLKNWALKEFEKYGTKVNLDALNLLLSYTGNDLWQASNEIKKLSEFKNHSTIRKEDVDLQIHPRFETDIFKTIDALGQKNKKQALSFMKRHLDYGENPLYLLSMIAYQFKNLLIVKELADKRMMYGSIIKKSGLHPFVVKKTYFMCSQFSLEELKKIYHKIFQADLDIKKGKVEPETALDLLVSQI